MTFSLESLVYKLNSIVTLNAAGEKFITFFVARYDHESGALEYINAAHNPPVLYNTVSRDVSHLRASCVGLGMLDEIPVVSKSEILIRDSFEACMLYRRPLGIKGGWTGKISAQIQL